MENTTHDPVHVGAQLVQMASYFLGQSPPHIFDAIRCLEAICQAKHPLRFPLLLEADARIRIAEILISYSRNIDVAKAHLDNAVRFLVQKHTLITLLVFETLLTFFNLKLISILIYFIYKYHPLFHFEIVF